MAGNMLTDQPLGQDQVNRLNAVIKGQLARLPMPAKDAAKNAAQWMDAHPMPEVSPGAIGHAGMALLKSFHDANQDHMNGLLARKGISRELLEQGINAYQAHGADVLGTPGMEPLKRALDDTTDGGLLEHYLKLREQGPILDQAHKMLVPPPGPDGQPVTPAAWMQTPPLEGADPAIPGATP